MMTSIIFLGPTRIRPNTIYDERNYWAHRNIKWA
jgi:hypothetical protein